MPRIKEIKPEEQEEEKQEEQEESEKSPKQEQALAETLDNFVESEIQAPNRISAEDLTLQSGQALPQVAIQERAENLEKSLENVPTNENDETKNTQYDKLYDENLDFYENKQKPNEPDRVVKVGRLMNPEAIIHNPQERITDFNFRKVEMIRHSSQEASRDNEMYEVGNLRPDTTQRAPSAQDDTRLKKYKPRM